MGIQLFKHNAEAYSRAVRLLENAGRAAVIHPTGTGAAVFFGCRRASISSKPSSKMRGATGFRQKISPF